MTRSRRRSSTRVSVDYSVPSFRLSKTEASLCADQSEAVCEVHDHHGITAIAEEEAALEHSAALTAAKQAALLALQRMDGIEAAAGVGEARSGSSSCLCLPPPRHRHLLNSAMMSGSAGDGAARPNENDTHNSNNNCEEEEDEHHVEEEEEDHFLSGLCLPRSQFFQTSVICSNTMARDALALCLVSFTFISKSLTLDSVRENIGEEKDNDHLSLAVGYACFAVAFFAAIYSPLKYLR
ncbi:hypothetical protein BGW39_010686 [Mortierella sp. 14UC]|nr:hypothetical protein BGW39_010686 [Mortierella sp. 14UC]